MTEVEAAEKEADEVERAAKRPTLAHNEESDDQIIARPSTPRDRLAGESQGGNTITIAPLPIRVSPRKAAPSLEHDPFMLPTSTAPPRLEEGGCGKRKRTATAKYEKAKAEGLVESVGLSQHRE